VYIYICTIIGQGGDHSLAINNPYGIQLVADFVEFCLHKGGTGNDPLFSRIRHGRTKLLNYDMVAHGAKASATACGLDPTVFSTHS
jgi:hypothetical protein